MTPIHHTSSCMGRITVSHKLRAAWMKSVFGALQPLVEAETEPSLLCQDGITTLGCLCPQLMAAGVKWLSSIALHCHSALQPAMDGIHFALACLSLVLRWDCRQSLPNTTVLLVSTLPSLLPTKAKLQARHYQIRLRPETVWEQCETLAFGCIAVEVAVCYSSSVTALIINRLWCPGISAEFIDCVWVQPQVCICFLSFKGYTLCGNPVISFLMNFDSKFNQNHLH